MAVSFGLPRSVGLMMLGTRMAGSFPIRPMDLGVLSGGNVFARNRVTFVNPRDKASDKNQSYPFIVPLSIRQELLSDESPRPLPMQNTLPIFLRVEPTDNASDMPWPTLASFQNEEGGASLMYSEDMEDMDDTEEAQDELSLDSVKRKRRTKMNRHKYRKRLKKNRFLRRSLGK